MRAPYVTGNVRGPPRLGSPGKGSMRLLFPGAAGYTNRSSIDGFLPLEKARNRKENYNQATTNQESAKNVSMAV